jgi:hypothetical protein
MFTASCYLFKGSNGVESKMRRDVKVMEGRMLSRRPLRCMFGIFLIPDFNDTAKAWYDRCSPSNGMAQDALGYLHREGLGAFKADETIGLHRNNYIRLASKSTASP